MRPLDPSFLTESTTLTESLLSALLRASTTLSLNTLPLTPLLRYLPPFRSLSLAAPYGPLLLLPAPAELLLGSQAVSPTPTSSPSLSQRHLKALREHDGGVGRCSVEAVCPQPPLPSSHCRRCVPFSLSPQAEAVVTLATLGHVPHPPPPPAPARSLL